MKWNEVLAIAISFLMVLYVAILLFMILSRS